MSIRTHAAIDALCEMMDAFPKRQAAEAVFWACLGVGKKLEPTGLEPTRTRTMGQLHWGLTTNDLREKLTMLVDETGIDEQLIVQGIVAFLDYHFADHASPASSERAKRNHVDAIERLERELTLPIVQRRQQLTDADIHDLITKMKEALEGCETRRQEAEAALETLREASTRTFTNEFWREFFWNRFRGFGEI